MAENNFGIGPGPHELKLGSSFTGGRGASKFQTIRYDFKPASVDATKKGKVEIGESNSLSVTVPHSNGTTETTFKGNVKPSNEKECVLIIDRHTGEITLEKLSSHMLLKKTRQENRKSEKQSAQIDKFTLNNSSISTNLPSASSLSNPVTQPPFSATNSSSRPQTPVSNFKRESPAGTPKPISRSASPHIPINSTTTLSQAAATVAANKVDLSESSSDSSSSGSDSEDSDFDDVPNAPALQKKPTTVNPSMPSFLDTAVPSPPARKVPEKTTTHHQVAPPQSMPQFLNDDLQLSESDDDSD